MPEAHQQSSQHVQADERTPYDAPRQTASAVHGIAPQSDQEIQLDRAVQEAKLAKPTQPERQKTSDRNDSGQPAPIGGFILLSSNTWDVGKLKMHLRREWGIVIPERQNGTKVHNQSKNAFIWKESGMTVAISLSPSPVPDGEAEQKAANNFFWPEAVEVTQTHTAHILVAVLPGRKSVMEAGKLCVKLCSSCSRLDNALGVCTSGTVYQPDFYQKAASGMKDGDLPILNWIYFGLSPSDNGINGYTYGMEDFGLEELEVIDSWAAPQDLYGFLVDIASFIMISGTQLHDGETFGFTEDQKLPITRSKGVLVDGYSLKIGYKPAP